jgi:hypothetical protein
MDDACVSDPDCSVEGLVRVLEAAHGIQPQGSLEADADFCKEAGPFAVYEWMVVCSAGSLMDRLALATDELALRKAAEASKGRAPPAGGDDSEDENEDEEGAHQRGAGNNMWLNALGGPFNGEMRTNRCEVGNVVVVTTVEMMRQAYAMHNGLSIPPAAGSASRVARAVVALDEEAEGKLGGTATGEKN